MDTITETFPIQEGAWHIQIEYADETRKIVKNFRVFRPDGLFFEVTMMEDEAYDKQDVLRKFVAPFIKQHGKNGRIGDVVPLFFWNKDNGRWMVLVEWENAYDHDGTISLRRICRNSVDNARQFMKKSVRWSGVVRVDNRRISGWPIKTHFAWSRSIPPQLPKRTELIDVFELEELEDAQGLAAVQKALMHMPKELSLEIFAQMLWDHDTPLLTTA